MGEYKRHIPRNSLNFMLVFRDNDSMMECMNSSEFREAQSTLLNIALSHGAEVKGYTNPK